MSLSSDLSVGLRRKERFFRGNEIIYLYSFLLGKSKEAEIKRINKELANIRSKFKGKCYPFLQPTEGLVMIVDLNCQPNAFWNLSGHVCEELSTFYAH
jgi:hypothetical protein